MREDLRDGSVRLRGREVGRLGERERSLLRRRHYGFVFQFGQLLAEGTAEEVRNHPEVVRAYLGEEVDDPVVQAMEHALEELAD